MIVEARNLEIRGVEKRTSKKSDGEYLIVRVEDETGRAYELLDRDVENMSAYKRGVECNLTLDLRLGKYTNVSIVKMDIIKV
ncbi:hypothetical protein [Faecalitalea cylindroides]|uniref:Uncharacterized protein n=1 Tax=Faecalitalea cylindroides ATCC 27803 TaxID=649755 RepID=U2R842_9FIRM|nr:hypothetical protein [Faecalitalea cylindroides]ERK46867.1 hypothetical protein HMPREF0367_00315 [[Eubacterium] cylindroides ATCC 27803] [Faecalitalea cylindroides ATCC 27803]